MGQFDNQEWVQQYYGSGQHDVVGPSQLSGAPVPTQGATQEDLTPLPEAGRRPGRDIVPPDPLTYPRHHTRAAQAAGRRARRGAPKRGRI